MGVIRREKGQMTVELAVVFPVLIAVAVLATNALLFFSECAAFDRSLCAAVRIHAASPAYEQSLEQSCTQIQSTVAGLQDRSYLETEIAVESLSGGHARFTGTLHFSPTLFGLGLRSSVLGVSLPRLQHQASFVIDPYKPGVLI